jgi:hypothetical protein
MEVKGNHPLKEVAKEFLNKEYQKEFDTLNEV